jgi:hypothetical protein
MGKIIYDALAFLFFVVSVALSFIILAEVF